MLTIIEKTEFHQEMFAGVYDCVVDFRLRERTFFFFFEPDE